MATRTIESDSKRTVIKVEMDAKTGVATLHVQRDGRAMHFFQVHKEDFDDGVPTK